VVVEENDRPVASVELMRKALTKGVNKFCVHDRGDLCSPPVFEYGSPR
jgi:hypothetical protein